MTAKTLLLFTTLLLFNIQNLSAQKPFEVTIKLDSSIDPTYLQCYYSDGINEYEVKDSLINHRIHLSETIYAAWAVFYLQYKPSDTAFYTAKIFTGEYPAAVELSFVHSATHQLLIQSATNTIPVWDTAVNKILGGLLCFNKDAGENLNKFLRNNEQLNIFGTDSLKQLYISYLKAKDARSLEYLKKHPDDYFSFWYFRNYIALPVVSSFPEEKPYLDSLLNYMQLVFPKKYIESKVGVSLIKRFNENLHPFHVGEFAPTFTGKDQEGHFIHLEDFKGKYVLVNFWSGDNVHCEHALAMIKALRNAYTADKLAIIGVNQDSTGNKVIQQSGLTLPQVLDPNKDIAAVYGIYELPSVYLIDKQGKIAYMGTNQSEATQEIEKILNQH